MGKFIVIISAALILSGCNSEGSTSSQQCEADEYQKRFLQNLNSARNTPRFCGNAYYISADPVRHSCTLELAAEVHSLDRAYNNVIGHIGSDGLTVAGRVTDSGYPWVYVGEAMAITSESPQDAFQNMLEDPRYCGVMMDPSFEDSAIAKVIDASDDQKVFWTLVMAQK